MLEQYDVNDALGGVVAVLLLSILLIGLRLKHVVCYLQLISYRYPDYFRV